MVSTSSSALKGATTTALGGAQPSRCFSVKAPLNLTQKTSLSTKVHLQHAHNQSMVCRAVDTASEVEAQPSNTTDNQQLIPELVEFLKEDLNHLFDDQGIDTSKYDPEVEFEDPITKYSSLTGYLLNIQFLRRVFDPTFILRDIKQTDTYEITTRWTMTMKPTFTNVLGPLKKVWNPELTFTGTSIMAVNPKTGKFNKHVDTWDAIKEQKFFSFEAFVHMLSQVSDLRRTPQDLETPKYEVLKKFANFEVREYAPFAVAEAPLDLARLDEGVASRANPASAGFRAFNDLAGYIFGNNAAKEKMAMTTPVFSDTSGKMAFYLGSKTPSSLTDLPKPNVPQVSLKQESGGIFAVRAFSGIATEEEATREEKALRAEIKAAGMEPLGNYWSLARYNDPSVLPPFRRNEVLIPIENFKLW